MSLSRHACLLSLALLALASSASADRSSPGRSRKPADRVLPAPGSTPAATDVAPAAPVATPAPPAPAPVAPAPPPPAMPLAIGPGGAVAPAPVVPAGPAGKALVENITHDAGNVERGTDLVHAFEIKNVGEHPLTVDAKPGCGCTVTEYDKVIAPGAVGKVNARVHTTNFKGQTSKIITVTTNDPDNPRFTLTMKANVLVPLDIQPGESMSFNGKWSALAPQQATISSTNGEPFDITSVSVSDTSVGVTVVPVVPGGGTPQPKAGTVASGASKYQVTVAPTPNIAVGRLSSTITLKTTHPKAPEQVIRLFGSVTGDVEVVPQYVTLSTGAAAPPEAKVQHVIIKKPSGEPPLDILSVTSDNPQVVTSLVPVAAGREYDLEVRYTGEPLTTALSAKVNVKTNDPKQPSLDIQIWGRVDPGMRAPQAAIAPGQAVPAQASQVPASP